MNFDWLADGRKIPDDVMYYIRAMAVNAVRALGQSPEAIAKAFNFNRPCIYRWLRQYDEGGFEALKSGMPAGAEPLVTGEMDNGLKQTVLNKTPADFGYGRTLWACAILSGLLKDPFGVTVGGSAVRLHLKALGLAFQKPEYQDVAGDAREVEYFLNVKFPKTQRLAAKPGADIAFQDESGVGVTARHGRTWGLRGKTPIVKASMKRGGHNILSAVTAQGDMRCSVKEGSVDGGVFIAFLKRLIQRRQSPLVVRVDHAPFHGSKPVRDFVREHRAKLRLFFLPKRSPELNPDEQVWNEVKINRIGKQPVKDKQDLKKRLFSALGSLQKNAKRVISFFQLPDTKYAYQCES